MVEVSRGESSGVVRFVRDVVGEGRLGLEGVKSLESGGKVSQADVVER